MGLASFLAGTIIISMSGVMAPGPMTAATLGRGGRDPRAGAYIAIGHGIIEFPLMVAIYYGIGAVPALPALRTSIMIAGGLFLLYMAFGMFTNLRDDSIKTSATGSSIMAGILLSAGNPYFFIWWITLGASLIFQAKTFGTAGCIAFALLHWMCDFAWSSFLSVASYRGARFFGRVFQKILFSACGVALVFFGGKFLYDGITALPLITH